MHVSIETLAATTLAHGPVENALVASLGKPSHFHIIMEARQDPLDSRTLCRSPGYILHLPKGGAANSGTQLLIGLSQALTH